MEILIGEIDHVTVIDAYLDQVSFQEQLEEAISAIPEGEQVILLSDLFGGSVNREMYLFLERPNTFLVAGMNLPLLLELALRKEPINKEILEGIIEASKKALRLVELDSTKTEEDFLEDQND